MCHYWRGNVDLQIVLDSNAAIAYMVKYATKGEKAGHEFNKLYNDIIDNSENDDNPQSKMRSLMMKSIAGKRDLGFYSLANLNIFFILKLNIKKVLAKFRDCF